MNALTSEQEAQGYIVERSEYSARPVRAKDITILYYTSNRIPKHFAESVRAQLLSASLVPDGSSVSIREDGKLNGGFCIPIVSVSQKPLDFGKNICVGEIGVTTLNLYRQVLIAAKAAETPYVALCEDDCLYLPSHFTNYRPPMDAFGYNQNKWTVFAWDCDPSPIMSNKEHRCVLNQCIAPRTLLIEALEERFALVATGLLTEDKIRMHFCEPGRHEKWLGVTLREKVEYWAPEPSIVFCHLHAMDRLGKRKRHGEIRVDRCEPWGTATDVLKAYVGIDEWRRQRRA